MPLFIDITGNTYGKLTVMGLHCSGYYTKTTWDCMCECGTTCIVNGYKLRSGHTHSCGCLKKRGRYENLINKKFNLLTVISFHSKNKNNKVSWNCKCDCGGTTIVQSGNLKNSYVKSCGCLLKSNTQNIKHGLKHHRLYNIWDNMKARCYRKTNPNYKHYGARGIHICQEWLTDFMNFYNWAISNGYSQELTIERENNDGNYEPLNCRWATIVEQSQNTRSHLGISKVIEIKELLQTPITQKEIAAIYNVNIDTITKINTNRTYKNISLKHNRTVDH